MKRIIKLALAALALLPAAAQASDWTLTGPVTMVEASHEPNPIYFVVTGPVGSCNGYLRWNMQGSDEATQIANSNAAFALLMTAKSTGQNVRIAGNNDCGVDLLYLVQ